MTSALHSVLPTPKGVRDLWELLFGRDVNVSLSDFSQPRSSDSIGEFVDDYRRRRVLAICDLDLAVYAGCAFGLMPAAGARDMIEERYATGAVLENVYEILNVSTALFNFDGRPHVRLGAFHGPGQLLPPAVQEASRRVVERLDLAVEIAKYGSGRLAFVLT
jgi:hypothetical protein